MPLDAAFWKRWEGDYIDSAFPLQRYVGGNGDSAVFETEFQGSPAAIKIVAETPESIESRIALWKQSADLSHPALVKTLTTGQAKLGDKTTAYIVMERAEDNLAAVLAERPLTPEETEEMIPSVLDVLQYLHANDFVHGSLKPPNIMAFGDQLKLSSDNLIPGGDPAGDGRAIGPLLKGVLGLSNLPKPFAVIANNAARWKKTQPQSDPVPAVPPSATSRGKGIWWTVAAGIAVALGLTLFLPPKDASPIKATSVEPVTAAPAPAPEVKRAPTETKKTKATKQPKPTPRETPMGPLTPGAQPSAITRRSTVEGITQVMPEIPSTARNTISGRVRIGVRVRVDNAGNVVQATPESPQGSKYFTDRVLAAARAWKFPAGNAPQNWVLHFELTRDQTRVSPARLSN